MPQECLPVAPSPLLRDDEKVFQVQALPPHEGGEIVEEQGEAYNCSVLLPEENLGAVLHEKGAVEGGFVRGHLIGALPIGGQLPDEVKDHSGLVSPCRAALSRTGQPPFSADSRSVWRGRSGKRLSQWGPEALHPLTCFRKSLPLSLAIG